MNILDKVVIEYIKTNKYQLNEAIYNEPMFDTDSFNASSGTMDQLPVVSVTLREGNKHIATAIDGITCLWDSGATNSKIKIKQTKNNEHKMRSNKVDYSTAAGIY